MAAFFGSVGVLLAKLLQFLDSKCECQHVCVYFCVKARQLLRCVKGQRQSGSFGQHNFQMS